MPVADDRLSLAGEQFDSRLILGTGGAPSVTTIGEILDRSQAQIVTVALRRASAESSQLLGLLRERQVRLLPNTAGCFTAQEAVLTARLAREAFETNWIKLEVIGDRRTLLPDVSELLDAAETLINEGFAVFAYTSDDPIAAARLAGIGCAAVMPLGSPIGSGAGIRNPYNIRIIRESIDIPLILDAGIGTASHAALAMELGCDGVLAASAITRAQQPAVMAAAIRDAVRAGRGAYRAGRIPERLYAEASTPFEGMAKLR